MAATIHQLSNERLILGIASGDRPVENPLMGLPFERRGEMLRENVLLARHLWAGGTLDGIRGPVTVRPHVGKGPPIVIAGMGQQTLQWIARNLDGWFTYPGPPDEARRRIAMWNKERQTRGERPPR
jgi:alkanesulfonate monooxygenase SsuD/methylene tetrahydromethanopterin reductase-like flavin-dependent oxidoreductase (luciferase family)